MEKIPKLYVETSPEDIIERGKAKKKCIIIQGNVEVMLDKGKEIPNFIDPAKSKFLKKEVYDRFYLYVDQHSQEMLCDAVIILPDRRTRIKLQKGDKLMLLPVEGFVKTLIADVGNRVRKGDAFAAITTKKGEVHYLKPPKNGTVIYIDEFTNKPHYIYYLLPENQD
ncbi:DUF2118 family protein [Thermococcus sp.]